MSEPLLRVEGVRKRFETAGTLTVFEDLSFVVDRGEMLAIVGQSGAGKSSLLHLLAALDAPSSGEIFVGGQPLSAMNERARANFRNRSVGYVWQAHYLLPEFTAAENVAMPLLARGESQSAARDAAMHWLGEVGLANRAENRAGELSGGEQQRVSLARALVTRPQLLLADEPTGNLDERTGEAIFSMLERVHAANALTTVLVTHSAHFAARCTRVLELREGRLWPASADVSS